jgi:hypothetical protein
MSTTDGTVGRYLGWFLAALSLGAGAIHFAFSGEHFDVTWYYGLFFAFMAWFQLSWAAALIVKPSRNLLLAGAAVNAVIIGVWVVTRTTGLPFGPESGNPESIGLADALSTAFEAGIVLLALAVVIRPALAQQSIRPSLGFGALGVSGLAVAVVSTMALTPSFASEHEHSHSDGGEAAGHTHSDAATGAETATAAGHSHSHGGTVISADGNNGCQKSPFGNHGNGGMGHMGPVDHKPLTPAQRAVFVKQEAQADAAVHKYSTVAKAEAAGYHLITPYVPCIGAHYIKASALGNGFNPAEPEIVLFDGQSPDSKVVGLSYLVSSPNEPEGFVGDNDRFHIHSTLCIGKIVVGDENTSKDECERRGGHTVDLGHLWMLHMWNAPGWDSSWGLFSSEHPDLGGTFGNINAPN